MIHEIYLIQVLLVIFLYIHMKIIKSTNFVYDKTFLINLKINLKDIFNKIWHTSIYLLLEQLIRFLMQ